jgi:hypothetical protein
MKDTRPLPLRWLKYPYVQGFDIRVLYFLPPEGLSAAQLTRCMTPFSLPTSGMRHIVSTSEVTDS